MIKAPPTYCHHGDLKPCPSSLTVAREIEAPPINTSLDVKDNIIRYFETNIKDLSFVTLFLPQSPNDQSDQRSDVHILIKSMKKDFNQLICP